MLPMYWLEHATSAAISRGRGQFLGLVVRLSHHKHATLNFCSVKVVCE